jgi:lysophospholipase L1-like esterase
MTPGNLALLLSLILITAGISLTLCADMVGDPATVSRTPESLPAQESEPSALSAEAEEPAEASALTDDVSADGIGRANPPAPAPAASAADDAAQTDAAESDNTGEAESVGLDEEAVPVEENASPAVSAPAAAAEKASEEERPSEPQPSAVDTSETDDYFSNALFIGDSRTQGLLLYSNLGNAGYYAARGLTVEQVFKKAVVDSGSGKLTVSDALSRRAFGKVYLMFGLNELGWNSADKVIEQYGRVIDRVRETQPDALIYVQSIMPVSARKSAKDPVHNNPNIARFNGMIEQLTEEKNVIYLNVGESVSDENGVLPEEASSDGIHLNKKYCIKWEEYLRAHEL